MGKVRLISSFGISLIKLCPGHVAAYVLLSFISQTAIPLALPVLLAAVTNAGQAPNPAVSPAPASTEKPANANTPAAQNQPAGGRAAEAPAKPGTEGLDIKSSYLLWLLLTLSLVPLAIFFRLAQTGMDNRMEKQIRQRLFDKVMRQPPEFFHKYNPGELNNVLTQTSVEAQQALRNLTVDPILQLVSLCIAMFLIIYELKQAHVEHAWPVVVLMVVFGMVSVTVVQLKGQKPVYTSQMEVQQQRFALAGLTDSAVKAPEEIQAMDAVPLFSGRYSRGLDQFMSLKRRQVLTMELVNSAIGFPQNLILAALYGYIVYVAVRGSSGIQPGVFISLALLTPQLMLPFKTFAVLGIMASASWPAVELVSGLLEAENRIKDRPGSKDVDKLAPTLEVRNVTFRYEPTLPKVFDDLTFSVPPGSITSLVARMGQGKTTFFRLVLRFYEPESGEILLGGLPASALTMHSLRRQVVVMSQFPAFFHDSVRENFRVAQPDATDQQIHDLCVTTGLWSILEKAIGPNPLDQQFAGGMGLSGGQKRLFALTRCLLRDPAFLFLDEPTTNMSNDEKYALIPVMRKACAGRTVIVVDHDIPWLIKFADHFVVLDNGRIAQQGPAEQLLAQPGILTELYTLTLNNPEEPSEKRQPQMMAGQGPPPGQTGSRFG
jgi:ABC-type multidrug transport system fused ATPase/permease subunit